MVLGQNKFDKNCLCIKNAVITEQLFECFPMIIPLINMFYVLNNSISVLRNKSQFNRAQLAYPVEYRHGLFEVLLNFCGTFAELVPS